jgi:hypothetical protein
VLDSGCGLSIILPVDSTEFLKAFEPLAALQTARKILRFCARELSWDEADPGHNPSVNCSMLLVPSTINSKNGAKFRVLQGSNGYRPSLPPSLYHSFLNYLMEDGMKERTAASTTGQSRVDWIEKLLQRPICSGRACAIECIFCPYLIRRVSKEEALIKIEDWLTACLALPKMPNLWLLVRTILDTSNIILIGS